MGLPDATRAVIEKDIVLIIAEGETAVYLAELRAHAVDYPSRQAYSGNCVDAP